MMQKKIFFSIFLLVGMLSSNSQEKKNLLVFSKTNGYRHQSIEVGKKTIQSWATKENWNVLFTEDSLYINSENLANIDVIVFLNTTGTILDDVSKVAFQKYINSGGGFVGIHSATDTEHNWPWYYQLIGAYFKNHPKVQQAKLKVHHDTKHPSIMHLKDSVTFKDEWYNFKANVLPRVNVLLTLDTDTYQLKEKEASHPISWYHYYEGGRVFYTGMGHTNEIYTNKDFETHLINAINWASKQSNIQFSNEWQNLLDQNFSNWDVFIGSPHVSVDLDGYEKSNNGRSGKPLGFANDPKSVFSMIKEGNEDVLKITGEIYGGLSTKQEYGNYHFKAQFKWGEKKWEPRLDMKRDNGLLYHCQGKHGAFWNVWMQSLEFQIQEEDCGDFYALGAVYGDVPYDKIIENGKPRYIYNPNGELAFAKSRKEALGRVEKNKLYEKPNGEWNTFELICLDDTSLHIVNGHVVNIVKNARYDVNGKTKSINSGKIQIQSEGAEAYFKNIQIKPITKFPKKYKRQANL